MSFYTLSDGTKPSGSAEDANIMVARTIPNDTKAVAKVTSAKLKDFDGSKFYEVEWELTSTNYKGVTVKQKIKCFDEDEKKVDRAKQMLVRLFKVLNFKPIHSEAPTDQDLFELKGRSAGIKVQQWFYNGKEGNWVSSLYESDGFESEEGYLLTAPKQEMSKMPPNCNDSQINTVYEEFSKQSFDSDIPF